MKRLLFLCAIMVASLPYANAQNKAYYHGEFELGYSSSVGNVAIDRFNFHLINGISLNDYFACGIGIGIDGYTYLKQIYHVLPVYANMKGFIPANDNITPYISLSCGIGFGISEYISKESGLSLESSIGMRLFENYKLEIGYHSQRISNEGLGINLGAIQLKVGFMF